MDRSRLWPRIAAAFSIALLVLATNEGHRYVRALFDYVDALESEVAALRIEVGELKAQAKAQRPGADMGPVPLAPAQGPSTATMIPLPLPIDIPVQRAPDPVPRASPKTPANEETKSLVSVVLMGESKVGPGKDMEVARSSTVRLLGDAK